MNDFPDIISTEIIDNKWDALWQGNEKLPQQKIDILALTLPFNEQSMEAELLGKIMGAGQLSADKYQVIQLQENEMLAWHKLKEKTQAKVILLFGVMPQQLGVFATFRFCEANVFDNAIWMPTLALDKLQQNEEARKHLWLNGVKPVFVDKQYSSIYQ